MYMHVWIWLYVNSPCIDIYIPISYMLTEINKQKTDLNENMVYFVWNQK